jgi:quercetin dioxygenase-like cupin family protein
MSVGTCFSRSDQNNEWEKTMGTQKNESVAQRIRRIRLERGLSVEALAEATGCASEYLQWVEEEQVEAPVAFLIQVAKALKLDSTALFRSDVSPDQRLKEAAKRTEHYLYKTLTPPESDKHLMAFSVTIPPKTAHKGVAYRHEGEEFVYVLSGTLELTVGDEKRTLNEKDSLRFNSNVDHHLSNPGGRQTELLVILYMP